tara:strand:+ start:305 stop:433 length:129 start_codon:yes stop_codon:yes gene_type:complete
LAALFIDRQLSDVEAGVPVAGERSLRAIYSFNDIFLCDAIGQ